jgi:hypothetical protein
MAETVPRLTDSDASFANLAIVLTVLQRSVPRPLHPPAHREKQFKTITLKKPDACGRRSVKGIQRFPGNCPRALSAASVHCGTLQEHLRRNLPVTERLKPRWQRFRIVLQKQKHLPRAAERYAISSANARTGIGPSPASRSLDTPIPVQEAQLSGLLPALPAAARRRIYASD